MARIADKPDEEWYNRKKPNKEEAKGTHGTEAVDDGAHRNPTRALPLHVHHLASYGLPGFLLNIAQQVRFLLVVEVQAPLGHAQD